MIKNEELEVLLAFSEGDGWVKARYYKDEESYVPQNYLDLHVDDSLPLSSAVAAADDGEGCEYVCRSDCCGPTKCKNNMSLYTVYIIQYVVHTQIL